MKWHIVLDSSCDLKSTDFDGGDIDFTTVPLKIVVGDKEYVDDDNVDTAALLVDMKNEKTGSSSACPSPGDFAEAFKRGDNIICLTLTGGLSGTYNSASVARDMVLEANPEKNIYLADTKATAGVLTLVAERAKTLIDAGKDFAEVSASLDQYMKTLKIVFVLSSYDNLVKNGRMSLIAGVIAGHLGIRAVSINSDEGQIVVLKKCRGEERALKAMVKIMGETKPMADKPVIISHCHNLAGAQKIKGFIEETLKTTNIKIQSCKALTTFYAMTNGILVAY